MINDSGENFSEKHIDFFISKIEKLHFNELKTVFSNLNFFKEGNIVEILNKNIFFETIFSEKIKTSDNFTFFDLLLLNKEKNDLIIKSEKVFSCIFELNKRFFPQKNGSFIGYSCLFNKKNFFNHTCKYLNEAIESFIEKEKNEPVEFVNLMFDLLCGTDNQFVFNKKLVEHLMGIKKLTNEDICLTEDSAKYYFEKAVLDFGFGGLMVHLGECFLKKTKNRTKEVSLLKGLFDDFPSLKNNALEISQKYILENKKNMFNYENKIEKENYMKMMKFICLIGDGILSNRNDSPFLSHFKKEDELSKKKFLK